MAEPIVFISHFRIKAGEWDAYRGLQQQVAAAIEADKPRTMVFLAHSDADGSETTITHVFPDAEAMAHHFEGSDERSRAAAEVMEPTGWEIYGSPGPAALGAIKQAAESSGVALRHVPAFVGGYLRGTSAG